MPALEQSTLLERAVLWRAVGTDGYGEPVVSDVPQEIAIRWNDKKRKVVDAKGNTVILDADIELPFAVPQGSILWRGRLSELTVGISGQSIPVTSVGSRTEDLVEVVTADTTPDIKARERKYVATVQRFRNVLPGTQ